MAKQHLYTVGGTVQAGSGLYIERHADTELLELCQAGTFAYVLSSRQMGKSSLMVRTSKQLMATGTHAVVVDLSNLGTQLKADAWYLGLLTTIADSLMLSTDVVAWWQAHAHLGQAQGLTDFFQEVLLTETEAPVVIFIDEIDSTLSLPFTDDFYAAIRSVYNARALVPAFRGLSFVLLGVATPSELISDPRRTPFNIGQRVEVTDFTYEEAVPLADGFGLPPVQAQQVLHWVLDWTGGHPYLTQRLCRVMADEDRAQWSETDVAQMVARTFFGEQSEQDHNLQFVRDMLTERAPEPVRVLATYRTIRQGRRAVRDEEQSLVLAHLKLSGVVRRVQRVLRVRNRIYETVFDLRWVREHWPVSWYRRVPPVVWGLLASLMAVVLLLGLLLANQQQHVRQLQESAERESKARQEAQVRQQEAERLRLVSLAQALAAQAPRQQESAYQDERAALLARQAYLFNQRSEGEVLTQIDDTLRTVLGRPYFRHVLRWPKEGVQGMLAAAFSPDVLTLACADSTRKVWLWDLRTPEAAPRVLGKLEGEVRAVAFSPDGLILASASGARTVQLWDLRTPDAAPRVLRGPERGVGGVAFSPDGATLASVNLDGTVQLWDLRAPDVALRVLRRSESMGAAATGAFSGAVAFSPDGATLASANLDGTVQLWDLRTPDATLGVLYGSERGIKALAFSPDGLTLASANLDGTVQLWDLQTPDATSRVLRGRKSIEWTLLEGATAVAFSRSVAFSPDGLTLASASSDGTVRLRMVRTADLATLVCTIVRRNLTLPEWRVFVGRGIPYERTCPQLPLHSSVLQEAAELARTGDLEAAVSLFRHALTLDANLAFQPEAEANKWAAQGLLTRGEALARQGHVIEALAAYTDAQQRDPTLHTSAEFWDRLCLVGSLWGQAAAVLHACEQAVILAPDDGSVYQSRGIARALTDDYNGAIADLDFFITRQLAASQLFLAWSIEQDKSLLLAFLAKRQGWIVALQAGRNPFDAATLEELRKKSRLIPWFGEVSPPPQPSP